MCFYALTDECSPRREDEISPHALPNEMKLVVVHPHIRARASDGILFSFIIVESRARLVNLPYIGLALEQTQRLLTGSRMSSC